MPITGNNPIPFEELLAIFIFLGAGIYLFARWVRGAPARPDPWENAPSPSAENAEAAAESPVCLRCLTPHKPEAYFCPHCGSAVGPYNNWMPYLEVFSEGQLLRGATQPAGRFTPFIVIGYLLFSLPLFASRATMFLAPIYWYLLWRNFRRYAKTGRFTPPPAAAVGVQPSTR